MQVFFIIYEQVIDYSIDFVYSVSLLSLMLSLLVNDYTEFNLFFPFFLLLLIFILYQTFDTAGCQYPFNHALRNVYLILCMLLSFPVYERDSLEQT